MPEKKSTIKHQKERTGIKSLLSLQNLAFVLVFVIFVVSVIWGEPISHLFTRMQIQDAVLIPTPEILPGTPTVLPVEYLSSTDQTSGILLGVIVIAIIVWGGTIGVLLRDKS